MQTSDPSLMDHFTKHFSKNTQAEYQLAFLQWELLAEWYLSMTLIKNGLKQYILVSFLIQTVSINNTYARNGVKQRAKIWRMSSG